MPLSIKALSKGFMNQSDCTINYTLCWALETHFAFG